VTGANQTERSLDAVGQIENPETRSVMQDSTRDSGRALPARLIVVRDWDHFTPSKRVREF
jgi:hypothetical protein